MEHRDVTAEISVVIAPHFISETLGDRKLTGRMVRVSTVQGIDGVLKMKQVGGSVLRSGLSEYFADKAVAFILTPRFTEKLSAVGCKLELLVTPLESAGIVDKLCPYI